MAGKLSFEAAIARLQEIVEILEKGEATLEDSMKLFEEGTKLSSFCYSTLSKAEQKVTDLALLEQDKQEKSV